LPSGGYQPSRIESKITATHINKPLILNPWRLSVKMPTRAQAVFHVFLSHLHTHLKHMLKAKKKTEKKNNYPLVH